MSYLLLSLKQLAAETELPSPQAEFEFVFCYFSFSKGANFD